MGRRISTTVTRVVVTAATVAAGALIVAAEAIAKPAIPAVDLAPTGSPAGGWAIALAVAVVGAAIVCIGLLVARRHDEAAAPAGSGSSAAPVSALPGRAAREKRERSTKRAA